MAQGEGAAVMDIMLSIVGSLMCAVAFVLVFAVFVLSSIGFFAAIGLLGKAIKRRRFR